MFTRVLLPSVVLSACAWATPSRANEPWARALIEAQAPPDRPNALPQYPGHEETPDQRRERFASIAHDAVVVASDPSEKPLFGSRKRTLATLLAVAFHESGFAHDVDVGPCYRGPAGSSQRCDSGRSACLLQIHIGAGSTLEGWTRQDLFADRVKCFRAGLHLLQRSAVACTNVEGGPEVKFVSYAGGTCESEMGMVRAHELWQLADTFYRWQPRPSS